MFVKADHSPNENKNSHYRKLDKLIFNISLELYIIIINIMSLKTELFALKCRINQATQIPSSSHIIIIMDVLHIAQKNFDFSIHLYQLQLIVISKYLRTFFNNHQDNSIEFWDCSGNVK